MDRLVGRMLIESGHPTTEEEAHGAAEPELVAEFVEARRIAKLVEAGETVDQAEIGAAITGYRSLYELLVAKLS